VSMTLQGLQQQQSLQALAAEPIASLPERDQRLHHLHAIAAAVVPIRFYTSAITIGGNGLAVQARSTDLRW